VTGELVIRATGTPAPKGSLTAIVRGRRALLIEDNAATRPWRKQLAAACLLAVRASDGWLPSNDAVEIHVQFILPRPATVKRDRPCVRPDIDKLARCVLDELQASCVLIEDGRVCRLVADKVYAVPGQAPGARIVVRTMIDQLAVI